MRAFGLTLLVAAVFAGVAAAAAPRLTIVRGYQRYSGEEGLAVAFGSIWTGSADSGDSVARTDIATGKSRSIHAPIDEDDSLAASSDAIWQADFGHGEVRRIDPATNRVTAVKTGLPGAAQIAFSGQAAFVSLHHGQAVDELDARTAKLIRRYPLPSAANNTLGSGPTAIAVIGNSLWVAVFNLDAVIRVDRRSGKVIATLHGLECGRFATMGPILWAACNDVVRIDTRTNTVTAHVKVNMPAGIAVLNGKVWAAAANRIDGIDPQTAKIASSTTFTGAFFSDLTAANGHLWPLDANRNKVDEISVKG